MPTPKFAALPIRAIGDSRLSASHWRLLTCIASHDRFASKGGCFTGAAKLAAETQIHVTNIARLAAELSSWGYIRIGRQPNNKRTTVYTLIYHDNPQTLGENTNLPSEPREHLVNPPTVNCQTLCKSTNHGQNGYLVDRPGKLCEQPREVIEKPAEFSHKYILRKEDIRDTDLSDRIISVAARARQPFQEPKAIPAGMSPQDRYWAQRLAQTDGDLDAHKRALDEWSDWEHSGPEDRAQRYPDVPT